MALARSEGAGTCIKAACKSGMLVQPYTLIVFNWLMTAFSFWNWVNVLILIVSKTLVCHGLVTCFQEKECLELKKERDKKVDQPKFVCSKNDEENARTSCSKSIKK